MGDKSQVATEYLIIVGFVIVILVPITIMYIRYGGESSDTVTASKIEHITNEIVAAANSVYAYGEGSQTKIEVDFPSNIKSIEFSGKEVIFTFINSQNQEAEIVQIADIELEGEITLVPGNKQMIIKSLGTSISVTIPCVDGEKECVECDNYYYTGNCLYECNNKVSSLTNLCINQDCDNGCSSTNPCTEPYETCASVENCPENKVGNPCGGLNVCCDLEAIGNP
ncbi:MAG: hypothetical protein KJ674_01390 [Nanoarchaeota archaeon]|nr:hypothetical protein [Nanoarchaeota archaeon]